MSGKSITNCHNDSLSMRAYYGPYYMAIYPIVYQWLSLKASQLKGLMKIKLILYSKFPWCE